MVLKLFNHQKDILKQVDALKLEILFRFGGVVMDADQICLSRLDEVLDYGLDYDYVAAYEHEHEHAGNIKAVSYTHLTLPTKRIV